MFRARGRGRGVMVVVGWEGREEGVMVLVGQGRGCMGLEGRMGGRGDRRRGRGWWGISEG